MNTTRSDAKDRFTAYRKDAIFNELCSSTALPSDLNALITDYVPVFSRMVKTFDTNPGDTPYCLDWTTGQMVTASDVYGLDTETYGRPFIVARARPVSVQLRYASSIELRLDSGSETFACNEFSYGEQFAGACKEGYWTRVGTLFTFDSWAYSGFNSRQIQLRFLRPSQNADYRLHQFDDDLIVIQHTCGNSKPNTVVSKWHGNRVLDIRSAWTVIVVDANTFVVKMGPRQFCVYRHRKHGSLEMITCPVVLPPDEKIRRIVYVPGQRHLVVVTYRKGGYRTRIYE